MRQIPAATSATMPCPPVDGDVYKRQHMHWTALGFHNLPPGCAVDSIPVRRMDSLSPSLDKPRNSSYIPDTSDHREELHWQTFWIYVRMHTSTQPVYKYLLHGLLHKNLHGTALPSQDHLHPDSQFPFLRHNHDPAVFPDVYKRQYRYRITKGCSILDP